MRVGIIRTAQWLWQWLCYLFCFVVAIWALSDQPTGFGRKAPLPDKNPIRFQPKPDWVKKKVVRLKALMPYKGSRKIADVFNRLYRDKKQMTVGKTFVCGTVKKHLYDIQILRRKIKHKKPRPLPKNLIWSMDLTQVSDDTKQLHTLFGIVDAGSRACLQLQHIQTKASVMLLRYLINSIEKYGKPKIVRTDNEAVFVSSLFRFGLWLLGIKHQRTQVCCPWQNGKIERFFGTLKETLTHYIIPARQLTADLALFRVWYNHVRTHQYLDGKTPAEVWSGQTPNQKGKHFYFEAWDDALTGFYLPPT